MAINIEQIMMQFILWIAQKIYLCTGYLTFKYMNKKCYDRKKYLLISNIIMNAFEGAPFWDYFIFYAFQVGVITSSAFSSISRGTHCIHEF